MYFQSKAKIISSWIRCGVRERRMEVGPFIFHFEMRKDERLLETELRRKTKSFFGGMSHFRCLVNIQTSKKVIESILV